MKTLLAVSILPLFWAVFCGLWNSRKSTAEVISTTAEIGAEYAQAGLAKARAQSSKKQTKNTK